MSNEPSPTAAQPRPSTTMHASRETLKRDRDSMILKSTPNHSAEQSPLSKNHDVNVTFQQTNGLESKRDSKQNSQGKMFQYSRTRTEMSDYQINSFRPPLQSREFKSALSSQESLRSSVNMYGSPRLSPFLQRINVPEEALRSVAVLGKQVERQTRDSKQLKKIRIKRKG